MRPLPALLLLLACAPAAPACAPAATGSRSDPDELPRAEIAELEERSTLDILRLRRPHWLRTRSMVSFIGADIVVYVDGMKHGDLDVLSHIPSVSVERVRYYDARQAQLRWGMGHTNGAIEVFLRNR